ncbi:MAG: VOC family protein [Flavobacteriaceae bacterium]
MASTAKNPVPAEMSRISPHLVCAGAADAMDFYKKAFGAEEMARLPGPDGKLMHGCMSIHGATVMLVDENPEWGALSPKSLNGSPVTMHVYVDDVDAAIARAEKAGATVRMPAQDMFWGDRYGVVVDPFGHSWSFATHLRDVTAEEIREAVSNMQQGCPDAVTA